MTQMTHVALLFVQLMDHNKRRGTVSCGILPWCKLAHLTKAQGIAGHCSIATQKHQKNIGQTSFGAVRLSGYHYLEKITLGSRKMKRIWLWQNSLLRIHRSFVLEEYCFWKGCIHHCSKVLLYKIALCEDVFLTLKTFSGLSEKHCFVWKLHGRTDSRSLLEIVICSLKRNDIVRNGRVLQRAWLIQKKNSIKMDGLCLCSNGITQI